MQNRNSHKSKKNHITPPIAVVPEQSSDRDDHDVDRADSEGMGQRTFELEPDAMFASLRRKVVNFVGKLSPLERAVILAGIGAAVAVTIFVWRRRPSAVFAPK